MAMAVSARRAVPQIFGLADRLCGSGHCQKKIVAQIPEIARPPPQELWRIVLEDEVLERAPEERKVNWVFLGRPGVGKGTFGSKLAKRLHVPHISTGDLIREELRKPTSLSRHISETVSKGKLLPDEEVLELLSRRLEEGMSRGEKGFILDGFPRTLSQAKILDQVTNVDLAVNFNLNQEALIRKCLGRRVCGECGQTFNVADVKVGQVLMPAMLPPVECMSKMKIRKDDVEESIRQRLDVYESESKPVEEYYRKQGKLVDFEVSGSVGENWPRLLQALNPEEVLTGDDKVWTWSEMGVSVCPKTSARNR